MQIKQGPLLSNVNYPRDLRKLEKQQLNQFSEELRNYIVDHVSIYGGHFGASLGVVELTVALHYAFNTPTDQLVWDVRLVQVKFLIYQDNHHIVILGLLFVVHNNQ